MSARSADGNLITPQGDPAPCHFNANPVRRMSVALSATLQLGCTCRDDQSAGPPLPARSPLRATCVVASKGHYGDRVVPHAQQMDLADPIAGDRKRPRRVVVETPQRPDLNRPAAAALLRIVLEAADRAKVVREVDDRSVQS